MAAYNKRSVDKAIKRSPKKISGKEAKLIHGLLKGRGPVSKPSKALTERYKKSQKNASAAFNEFQKASENKWGTTAERKRFLKAARAERAAFKRYVAANDAYAKALRGEK